MHTYRHRYQAIRASVIALAVAGSLLVSTRASAVPIDHIRLSRIATVTTTEIELGCAMRYLDHSPPRGGSELRIRLALGQDCHNALRGVRSSLHRPPGGKMAYLIDVEFDTVSPTQVTITLRFERPVSFAVRQTANEYMLTVAIDARAATASSVPLSPPPTAAVPEATEVHGPRNDGPSRLIQRPTQAVRDMFAIRLGALESVNEVNRDALQGFRSQIIYTNDVTVGERKWTELRLGFFATEDSALSVLPAVQANFPSAWISIATPAEQARARTQRLPADDEARRPPVASAPVSTVPIVERLEPLADDRVTALMADARNSLLRADYGQSIKIYTRLLEESAGQHRREAREFLGVARQKNGQLAHAKSEFEAYLLEFPAGTDATRVRQRLAALTERTVRLPIAAPAEQSVQMASEWDLHGGVSQFYLRGVNLTRDDEADVLTQSALLSQADFVVSRRGERIDLLARANFGYLYDFTGDGSEDQALVSYAYIDIADNALDLSVRVGRQTRHKGGVLGRFDGAHLSYRLQPDLSINLTSGFPVDSPRFLASPDHYFYGASIELANFADAWDFSVFTNLQTIDGISDRQALGAEAQYHTSRLNIVGQLDYDASYKVLNSGLVIGNWRVNDRLTLNGRYQGGAGPFLTTRNAIIGQPVNTVEALFATYSEGQIRRLARNRTAETRSASAGLSAELSQRWQLNADITYNEYGATVSSGGVAAFPASGPQYFYGGHLLGSSIVKAGDSLVLGYRHFESRGTDSDTVTIDLRYPLGDGLRINPRLALTLRTSSQSMQSDTQQRIASPMLRVLYRWRRKYRIEFEIGGQWSDRELPPGIVSPLDPDGSVESSAYYLQLGYWVDFR